MRRTGVVSASASLVAALFAALGGLAACRDRSDSAPPPVAPAASPPSAAASAAGDAADTDREARAAVDRAAFLTRHAADALVAEQRRRGAPSGDLAEGGLVAAIGAIAYLPSERARALGDGMRQVYAALPPDEHTRLEEGLARIRRGVATSEQISDDVALLTKGILLVPPETRSTLQAAFDSAVDVSIAMRSESERMAAQGMPPAAPMGLGEDGPIARPDAARPAAPPLAFPQLAGPRVAEATETGPGNLPQSPRVDKEEAYWRGRASAARTMISNAEGMIRVREARLAPYLPVAPTNGEVACSTGKPKGSDFGSSEARQQASRTVTCDAEALRRQEGRRLYDELQGERANLERAKAAMTRLEDEARRAGAYPGWLR